MVANDRWRRRGRPMLGWVISGALVVLLLARIDLADVANVVAHASLLGLAVAVALVALEVGVRARRWQLLLEAARPVAYSRAVAYLCVGYFANSLLPARLGDLARAHLAGRDLGIPRLMTLGTIVAERVADAALILGAVVLLGLMTSALRSLLVPALAILTIGGIASGVILVGLIVVDRRGSSMPGFVTRGRSVVGRIAAGADAMRDPRTAAAIVGMTVVAFGIASLQFWAIATAVGLTLTPAEAVIVMGALALSTAIPAAPGSLGTYELVGVAVLTGLGAPAAPALAAVMLMHVVATLPPALVGLVAFMRLQLHLGDLRPSTAPVDAVSAA